jgi:hypothetical protein
MKIIATPSGYAQFEEGDGLIEVQMANEEPCRLDPGKIIEMVYEGAIATSDHWRTAGSTSWINMTDGYVSQEEYRRKLAEMDFSDIVVGLAGKPSSPPNEYKPDEVPLTVLAADYISNNSPLPESIHSPPLSRTEDKRIWEDEPASSGQIETLKLINLTSPPNLTAGQASDWMTMIRLVLKLPDWRTPPSRIKESRAEWITQPATYGQRLSISSYGLTPPIGLTKGQASDWMQVLYHSKEAAAAKVSWDIREISGRTITAKSYHLKREAEEYRKAGDTTDARNWLSYRMNWWSNLHIKDDTSFIEKFFESAPTDMRAPTLLSICCNLYTDRLRNLALRVAKKPTKLEIKSRLDVLDATTPGWDHFKPHLFFE